MSLVDWDGILERGRAKHRAGQEARQRHLHPIKEFLEEAASKIADAHAAELSKLRLDNPSLVKQREQLRDNRDHAWEATIDQAEARFGSQNVKQALEELGRDRSTM